MRPRIPSKSLTILAAITIIAFGIAHTSNRILEQRFEAQSIAVAKAIPAVPGNSVVDIGQFAEVILNGHLFQQPEQENPTTADELADVAAQHGEPQDAAGATLGLKLVGTIIGPSRLTYAVIEAGQEGQRLYRAQEMVVGVAQVIRIARNEVTLHVNGKEMLLRTEFEENPPDTSGRTAMSQSASAHQPTPEVAAVAPLPASRKGGKERWTIDKREVEAAFANLPRLLSQARVMPHYSGGKMAGFRVVNVQAESLFDRIGLQPQDVLLRINGMEIQDPSRFLSAFQQVKEEETITLDLIREGHPSTFVYEIR